MALHPRDYIGRLYISRKEGGRGLTSIEDSVDPSIQRLEDYIEKHDGHTNGSPNLGQKTRLYNNQQKKKEDLQNCQLCCPVWPQNKTERMWKER